MIHNDTLINNQQQQWTFSTLENHFSSVLASFWITSFGSVQVHVECLEKVLHALPMLFFLCPVPLQCQPVRQVLKHCFALPYDMQQLTRDNSHTAGPYSLSYTVHGLQEKNIVWVGNEITITALMRYVNETELLVRLSWIYTVSPMPGQCVVHISNIISHNSWAIAAI